MSTVYIRRTYVTVCSVHVTYVCVVICVVVCIVGEWVLWLGDILRTLNYSYQSTQLIHVCIVVFIVVCIVRYTCVVYTVVCHDACITLCYTMYVLMCYFYYCLCCEYCCCCLVCVDVFLFFGTISN